MMKKTITSIIISLGCFAVCAEPIRSNVSARDIINAYEEEGMVEVEYLESTGTQYIDTMWLPQANHFYEVFVDFQYIYTESYTPPRLHSESRRGCFLPFHRGLRG